MAALCSVVPSFASILNLQFSATGSGDVGGVVFSDSVFHLTGEFDTANVQDLVANYYRVGLTNMKLNAGGTLSNVTIPDSVFVIVGPGEVGLLKGGANSYFIGGDFQVFGYTLRNPVGPFVDAPFAGSNEFLNTSMGEFRLTGLTGNATFEVTPSGVPEPGSAALIGLGVLAVLAGRRRY